MKSFIATISVVIAFLALVVFMLFYPMAHTYDPHSYWCAFKIYQQPNGTCEVWTVGRVNSCLLREATIEEARLFRERRCKEMLEFLYHQPTGKRVE